MPEEIRIKDIDVLVIGGGIMRALRKAKRLMFLTAAGFWLLSLIYLCGQALAEDVTPVAAEHNELLQVKVFQLIIDPASKKPVVILTDSLEERGLLIWIDNFEANAIHSEMRGINHLRPLTHDLLENIMRKADLNIQRIIITHIEQGIYYATILIEIGGSLVKIDARPSDSIVMALKFKVPVFVSERLFNDASIPLTEQKGVEELYGLRLQELTPSLSKAFSYDSTRGVLVSDVWKESRAERDGIRRGDILVEIGGEAVEDVTAIRNALKKATTPVATRIFRKAHFISVRIHPH